VNFQPGENRIIIPSPAIEKGTVGGEGLKRRIINFKRSSEEKYIDSVP
jgi:hypothetical protein